MAPTSYSGALHPKKKAELQEIASALRISDQGTKEDLLIKIKSHLDKNQAILEEEPKFAGLFGRRKRSDQPQPLLPSQLAAAESSDEKPNSPPPSRAPFIAARRLKLPGPVREATPADDARDVSIMLKKPISSITPSTAHASPTRRHPGTPSSLPPLPPSPSRSIAEVVSPPNVDNIMDLVRRNEEIVLQSGREMLWNLRTFLSNSRNIWSLTALFELLYLVYAIIPWKTFEVSLSHTAGPSSPKISLVYPPWTAFVTYSFWSVIGHWSLPTLFIPALFGTIISFNPTNPSHSQFQPGYLRTRNFPFDPLTASIIRLAAQVAYPFATGGLGVQGTDILGFRWRALSASVGVAFAFSEAIAEAPALFARSLATSDDSHQVFGGKRALIGESAVVGDIE